MFDNVGRTLDEESGKRTAASSAILALLTFTTVTTVTWLTHRAVTAIDPPPEVTELFFPEDPPPVQETEAPPAAPPRQARQQRGEPDVEPEPEPDPDVEPKPLDEPPPDRVADQTPRAGAKEGPDSGSPKPCANPPCGPGTPDGRGTGPPGGRRVHVHRTEVDVKKRVIPDYPEAAVALSLGEQRCYVRFDISDRGVPTHVDIDRCPSLFHEDTRRAAMKWRFYPYRDDGERVAASFLVVFTYRLD